jgi:hypothetical protein
LEALSGSRVLPNPRYDCLDAGCTLATEKITTHWNVVRELADQLVENDVLYSPDLLSLLGRHGLSGA